MENKAEQKNKIVLIAVIIVLLAVTAGAVLWYLSSRNEVPENSLVVAAGGKEQVLDIDKLSLESFSGITVNGKGEQKDINAEGVKLSSVIDVSDYSEVSVIADDAYSVVVKKEEIDNAWLQIEEGTARLIVFGDSDSKRNVKNVVRIEVE